MNLSCKSPQVSCTKKSLQHSNGVHRNHHVSAKQESSCEPCK